MYNRGVPNQRDNSKQIVAMWLDSDWIEALDHARKKLHMDRSTFIRLAISRQLTKDEVAHDANKVYPPDRTGASHGSKERKPRARRKSP